MLTSAPVSCGLCRVYRSRLSWRRYLTDFPIYESILCRYLSGTRRPAIHADNARFVHARLIVLVKTASTE